MRELKAAVGAFHEIAPRRNRTGAADLPAVRKAASAQSADEQGAGGCRRRHLPEGHLSRRPVGVHRSGTENAVSAQWTKAPAPSAKGVMKAAIASAVFQPRSLTIMKKLAMQGMKSVIVTIETTT